MTPAEELRAAAALMRDLANNATGGRWNRAGEEGGDPSQRHIWTTNGQPGDEEWVTAIGSGDPTMADVDECNAAHVAAWDPTVTSEVAEWLECWALALDGQLSPSQHGTTHALAVARAFMGGEQHG